MEKDHTRLELLASKAEPLWKRHYAKNKKRLQKMDVEVHKIHNDAMAQMDCLACANCCRTLGPRIETRDIERIAKALRMKESLVYEQYFRIDEDGDIVFKSMPCPFLADDNYCIIYESRPKACREYPHTDRKRFYQIYNLSIKNAYTCPVVYEVLENLRLEAEK